MAQFEIDLPTHDAVRFDRAFGRFLAAELADQPDVDVRTTSYSVTPGIERRFIFMSCARQLAAFKVHWQVAGPS